MEKYLIVNADDFGIHSAVNHAVYKAFHEGFLTSTSIIAGGKAFEEAVDLAKKNARYRDRRSSDFSREYSGSNAGRRDSVFNLGRWCTLSKLYEINIAGFARKNRN